MNDLIKQLKDRKSVRAFLNKEIPENIKKEILQSALEAPSAGNQQMYTILDIVDKKIIDELAYLCDNQQFIKKAKLVLVFCSDYKKWHDLYKYGGCNPRDLGYGDFLLSISDTIIAAQNTVLAAQSFGIGSCYIGDILENYERVKKLLGLPNKVVPITMVVYGYPTEQQKDRKKPIRPEIEMIVHRDKYKELKEEELEKLVSHNLNGERFEDWIKKFCERKYNSEFSKEMNRTGNKYIEEFK